MSATFPALPIPNRQTERRLSRGFITLVIAVICFFNSSSCWSSPESEAAFNRAQVLIHTTHVRDAMHLYDQAIQLDPNCEKAYIARADVYISLQEYHLALNDVNYVIKHWSSNPAAYDLRSSIDFDAGDTRLGQDDINKAVALSTTPETRAARMGKRAYFNYFLRNYQNVIDDCTTAMNLTKPDFHDFYYRGKAYLKMGLFAKSMADCQAALKLAAPGGAEYAKLLELRANIYDLTGKPDLAKKDRAVIKAELKSTLGTFFDEK